MYILHKNIHIKILIKEEKDKRNKYNSIPPHLRNINNKNSPAKPTAIGRGSNQINIVKQVKYKSIRESVKENKRYQPK